MSDGGGIIWVASYPKSGNTWVRFLLGNLVFGPQDTASSLNEFCPDLHELAALPPLPAQPVFMKTHFMFGSGLPGALQTRGVIYIARDPADVLLSNFYYARRSSGTAGSADEALPTYVNRFVESRGDPRWAQVGMGSWDQHARSWLSRGGAIPLLLLRYEDMRVDAISAARRLCQFLGIGRNEEQIAAAVAGSSFARMRAIEQADIDGRRVGIFYKPYLASAIEEGHRFMRQGQSGESRQSLTLEQRRRVYEALEPMASQLGYGLQGGPARSEEHP